MSLQAAIPTVMESTEAVIVAATALITAVGAAAVAITKAWKWLRHQIESLQSQSGETLHQVRNDHPSNLRDDIDEKFDSVYNKLDRLAGTVEELVRSDSRQWQRAADLNSRDDRLDTRVTQLEEDLHHR